MIPVNDQTAPMNGIYVFSTSQVATRTYFSTGMAMSSLQVVLWHEPPRYTSRTQLLWVLGGEPRGKDRSGRGDSAHSIMHTTKLQMNTIQHPLLLSD